MPTHLTNPAGRLHYLLSQISQQSVNHSVVDAWAEILSTAGDWSELLRLYGLVASLPRDIEAAVSLIDPERNNVELALKWQAPVSKAFEIDFARQVAISEFTKHYDSSTLAYLEFCDDLLYRHDPGKYIPPDELARIAGKIAELEADLDADAGLEPKLRAFLLDHSRAMSQAIRDVPVKGTAGLERALAAGIGDIYGLHKDKAQRLPPNRREAFLGILAAIGAVLTVGETVLALEEARAVQTEIKELIPGRKSRAQLPAPRPSPRDQPAATPPASS